MLKTDSRPMIDKPAVIILLRKVGRHEITADEAIALLDGWAVQAVPAYTPEPGLPAPLAGQMALAGPES